MNNRPFILSIIAVAIFYISPAVGASDLTGDDLAEIKLILQYPAITPNTNSAVEIKFDLVKDWHFYAPVKNTPQDMSLKIIVQGQRLLFSNPVFPKAQSYSDKVTNQKLSVYSGSFSVYIPFTADTNSTNTEINITINGVACNEQLCKKVNYELLKTIEISPDAKMDTPAFVVPVVNQETSTALQTAASIALPLAIVAGLLLNVMPCVWPILPIIVMRLVSLSEKSKAKSFMLGVAFAIGIILFFATLAAVNIILKLGFGLVFQWGDQFRNPAFVTGMAILMVVLALYMFGLFTFAIPASVSSNKQSGGFWGSVGMGFLAAVLSTPCSFAILTFVLAWAQTQLIPLATITILLIGAGMALPYVILTMLPQMLNKIPKPGRWMELFKHATGFILLAIGVKLLEAVPSVKLINILYYAIALSVCVWMWGVCVSYNTPVIKKWIIRIIAIISAVLFGFLLLTEQQKELINWQPYNTELISSAQQKNQPVLIDFTADWCLSCKILDKTVYSNKQVADLIKQKNVLAIKADTTGYEFPATKALKEIYNQPAVPVTILLLPEKNEPVSLSGNMIGTKLREYLQNLPDKNINENK